MKPLHGYMTGINIGGWISEYHNKGQEHWDSTILEKDIKFISEKGFDHIRLPVDYFFFESDENPGVYNEERLSYVDRTLEWCTQYGLNLIIDLHRAPGFYYGDGDLNDLFTNKEKWKRFVDIWKMFSARYQEEGDNLIFELLNEMIWENSDLWNELWRETVAEIHKISPNRRVIIGGNYSGSINELKTLYFDPDERLIYTFHFYEPFMFTHQRAGWIEATRNYRTPVEYPFVPSEHAGYYGGELHSDYHGWDLADIKWVENLMMPALDFAKKTGKTIYCGEFGVLNYGDLDSTVRWLNDMIDILTSRGIGRAVWNYRGCSKITSPDRPEFNQEIFDIVTRKEPREGYVPLK